MSDFVIENGVITKYTGKEKILNIPEEVNRIAMLVFSSDPFLEEVIFPNHTVEVEYGAFYGCSNLKRITISASSLEASNKLGQMFGETGKTIEVIILRDGMEPMKAIGAFRKVYWMQKWDYADDYLVPLTDEDLPNYDRLVATGEFEGFKMNEQGRMKAMIFRLLEKERPVSEEYRKMFLEFLEGKVSKIIKAAEEDSNAAYVRMAIEEGLINDANRKRMTNAIKKSSIEEIRQMADHMDDIAGAASAKQPTEEPSNIDRKYLDRLKKLNASAVLLKSGIETAPVIPLADGSAPAPAEYVQLVLAEYLSQQKKQRYEFAPLADEVAQLLNRKELVAVIVNLYENARNDAEQSAFLPLLFRFADGKTIESVCRKYSSMKWMEVKIVNCLLLSDTREAMILVEKRKMLGQYALMRGISESYLLDSMMYEFGFDENGKKIYELGNKKIEVTLNDDLTLRLCDLSSGKTIKSIPKKDADPEKYAEINADFTDTKKNIKKAAKSKSERLFREFLAKSGLTAERWLALYPNNPLLRQIANLLVWEQDGKTFTLSGKAAIDADNNAYTFSDGIITLAHPMEMKAKEIKAWQKYFTSRGLKQPFEQIWEPVVKQSTVMKDRYAGCMIPYYRFLKQEKHGIHVQDLDFHNEINIWIDGCNVSIDRIDFERHSIEMDHRFEIKELTFRKYTRQVNHIVAYFDRITVYDRIRKDDVSIAEQLPRFTLAQITEFINVAIDNNCSNVSAILLDYKNRTFADLDPMDAFALEW